MQVCARQVDDKRKGGIIMDILIMAVVMALVLTVGTLAWGLSSMAHGGSYDSEHSEKLMFTRVSIQAIAFALIVVALIMSLV